MRQELIIAIDRESRLVEFNPAANSPRAELHGGRYAAISVGRSLVGKGVERMGGSFGVELASGKGSRFWIELPKAGVAKTA